MYYMVLNQELYHHGIKGQKWGVRRYENADGSLTAEGKDRYSRKQFNRDKGIYGTVAAKRLQRKMQDPNQSIQGLRSKEAERIEGFRKAASIAGKVGGAAGAIGGYIGARAAANSIKYLAKEKWGGRLLEVGETSLPPEAKMIISAGGGAAGAALGAIGASSITMLAGGYSPMKMRKEE